MDQLLKTDDEPQTKETASDSYTSAEAKLQRLELAIDRESLAWRDMIVRLRFRDTETVCVTVPIPKSRRLCMRSKASTDDFAGQLWAPRAYAGYVRCFKTESRFEICVGRDGKVHV